MVYNTAIACSSYYIKWIEPNKCTEENIQDTRKIDKKALKYSMVHLDHASNVIMKRSNGTNWKRGLIHSYQIQYPLKKLSKELRTKLKIKNKIDYSKWIEVCYIIKIPLILNFYQTISHP